MVSGLSVREAAVLGLLPGLAELGCDGVAFNGHPVSLQPASAAQGRLQPAPCCRQTEFHCCEVKGTVPSPLQVPGMGLRQPWAGDGCLSCPSLSWQLFPSGSMVHHPGLLSLGKDHDHDVCSSTGQAGPASLLPESALPGP